MKKIFAKIIPVKHIYYGDRKESLCILSTDTESITIGDEVYHERGYIGIVTDEKYNDAEEVQVNWYFDVDKTFASRTSLIYLNKILGEVSDDVKWVKEGDEFNVDEIFIESYWGGKDAKELEPNDPVRITSYPIELFDREGIIKNIKRTEDECWNWEDLITVTNVRLPSFDPEDVNREKIIYKGLPDITVERREVTYKYVTFNICKIKCSQCETFH